MICVDPIADKDTFQLQEKDKAHWQKTLIADD
jgi:hypothetical protein